MKSTRVVSPLDFWQDRDWIYIGYTQCKESLRQVLDNCKKRKRQLPLPETLLYLRELAAAVEDLHRCDYAHNDLHAANVLFTEDGELKLTDLQLSMRTNSDAQNTQLSMSDSTLNLKNRAPEVVNNATMPPHLQKQLTPAVDVYSFGVLGVQLFNADSALEVQLQVQPQREMTPAPRGRRGELKVLPKPAPEAVKDPSSLEKLSMPAHVRAEAIALLETHGLANGDAVLVKGSNSVGLGRVVTHLTEQARA
jgi:serine/threonine protein kinase